MPESATRGTVVVVSELAKQWQIENNPAVRDELASIFALYLNDYAHVHVSVDGERFRGVRKRETRSPYWMIFNPGYSWAFGPRKPMKIGGGSEWRRWEPRGRD